MEWNALLAMGSFLTPEQLAAKKKLSLIDQGRIMVKALPRVSLIRNLVLSDPATTSGLSNATTDPPGPVIVSKFHGSPSAKP